MRDEIKKYYASEIEKDRLDQDHFKLEGIRTQQIIRRYLSPTPLNIIDVGGGAGFYAFWQQSLGLLSVWRLVMSLSTKTFCRFLL